MNVRVLEAAHDLDDGVHFADVGQKFIAQAFARRRAFHETSDVHELDRRQGIDDARLGNVLEHFEPRVRHDDDADVRVNGVQKG